MINNNFGLKNLGYSNFEATGILPRQRWYYYKEGFSSELVEFAIKQLDLGPDKLIIDPFNGSGTTTLTASLLGIDSIGVEVNPFTSFLSQTKLVSIDSKALEKHLGPVKMGIEKGRKSELEGFSTFTKTDKLDKWLFNTTVIRGFEGGWTEAQKIESIPIRSVFQLALITAAMENCNAKKDGKGLKYRSSWSQLDYKLENFQESFQTKIDHIKEDLDLSQIITKAKIVNQDVRSYLSDTNKKKKFNLCVTSPPYLNTFDYTDIYRPELFLGKFLSTKQDLYNLRTRTLRSHIHGAIWNNPKSNDFGVIYKESMAHVINNPTQLMHKKIPLMIQAYFEDMKVLFEELKLSAASGSQIWIIVSNSAYANKEIPVDLILGDIGSQVGLSLKEIGVLRHIQKRKTKHSPDVKKLRESVIIFNK
ncbi:site-specific DNA-methyltransferase [Muricauda sp. SCSIO 64092]|uniref:DNA methyltransferase n=1 Tax=Allomuricauda sp. SCSIO 64092 TaxID=2908842 RepID=UPI001FF5CCEF|nr:DNA methyltransferase [Muricauda sp. SCSIO 64092]UOY08913.1 site-specific DNA-methyltransferase [Muricauda sp. SCSIO 64092]